MLFFTIFVYASNPNIDIMKISQNTDEKFTQDKYEEFLDDALDLFDPNIEKDALNLIAYKMESQSRMDINGEIYKEILTKKLENEFYSNYFFEKYSFNKNFVAKNLYELEISSLFINRIIEIFDLFAEKLKILSTEYKHVTSMQKDSNENSDLSEVRANMYKFQNDIEISLLILKLYHHDLLGYYIYKLYLITNGIMEYNGSREKKNFYNGIPCLIKDIDGIFHIGNKCQGNIYKFEAVNLENFMEKQKEYMSLVQMNVNYPNRIENINQNMKYFEFRVKESNKAAENQIITGTKTDDLHAINDDKKQDLLFLLQLDFVDENIEMQEKD